MDKYEELLIEIIENARKSQDINSREELIGEADAYEDALILYRNLKAKGEI